MKTEPRNCEHCGAQFIWRRAYRNQRFCSRPCKVAAFKLSRRSKEPPRAAVCEWCGGGFTWTPKRPTRVYCCAECCQKALARIKRARMRPARGTCLGCGEQFQYRFGAMTRQWYCDKNCWARADRRRRKGLPLMVGKCACGEPLPPWATKYCSTPCKSKAYRKSPKGRATRAKWVRRKREARAASRALREWRKTWRRRKLAQLFSAGRA